MPNNKFRFIPLSVGFYATDASMYQIQPIDVVLPVDREDLLQAIRHFAEQGLPLLARGGGTSLTGQCIGEVAVLDLSRHLNRILELNIEEGWVRVEPGIVCSELNAFLKPYNVRFAPDPATENRASIGGMIANNSAGMRSVRYGMTIDHVLEADLVLAAGEVLQLSSLPPQQLDAKCRQSDREGQIYRDVRNLVSQHAEEIRLRYPKVLRRSGGYALDALVDTDQMNLAKLICGSEGTLGVIVEAKLKLTSLPRFSAVCLAHFDTLDSSLRTTALIVSQCPSAVELLDGVILRQARLHPLTRDTCALIQDDPAAVLVIEVQGDDRDEVSAHILRIADSLSEFAYAVPVMNEEAGIKAVWQLRSSALGLMTTVKGPRKPVPYIEDAAVPPEVLADYVAEVLEVCHKYNQPVSLFGHASVGLLHIRPMHDLHKVADREGMKKIQEEIFLLVQKYGGSWSGEHGDGIVRGGFNRRFFGEELYGAFREIKQLFDPENRMNPGKVIDTPPVDSQLRFGIDYKPIKVNTLFYFRDQGGMLAAAEQCTGVGECRKTLSGAMCPSFMATRDEMHSTRGRANTLRLVLSDQLGVDALASEELAIVMDLCLSCKGCKGECPNGVDMAKLKSEVLYHYQKKNGITLRTRLFGNISMLSRLAAGPQSSIFNALMDKRVVRVLAEKMLGIDADRTLPAFARQTLSCWYNQHKTKKALSDGNSRKGNGQTVVLFNDTYTQYNQPEVGRAAIEVLETAGYSVILATLGDSQRTAISQGLLDQAKQRGTWLFEQLDFHSESDIPILVCEPSCASALTDDLPDLIENVDLSIRVANRVKTIDQFLEQQLSTGRCTMSWKEAVSGEQREFLVHSHCHQKTLDGAQWTHRLLARIPGAVVKDTEAGCCGMAGSFGYEAEHAELSRKIAAERLLPRLAAASMATQVVANGFSCRHQIADLTDRKPLHVIQVLHALLNN